MSEFSKKALGRWLVTVVGCLAVAGGLGFFKMSEIQAGIAASEAQPELAEVVEV